MLHMSQLSGFGSGGPPALPFGVVRTGNFSFSFAASATTTCAITGLGAPSSNKQLLLCVRVADSSVGITKIAVDGIECGVIHRGDMLGEQSIHAVPFTGFGSTTVTLTASISNSFSGDIEVYEVNKATPLYKCFRNKGATLSTNNVPLAYRTLAGDITVAFAMQENAAGSFTWAGATEQSDYAAAGGRGSSATTAAAGAQADSTITPTFSGGSFCEAVLVVIAEDTQPSSVFKVKGGHHQIAIISSSSTTVTSSFLVNLLGMGSGELIVFLTAQLDATVSAMTFAGNAMTFRGSAIATGATPDVWVYCYSIPFSQAGATSGAVSATLSVNPGSQFLFEAFALYDSTGYGTAGSNSANAAACAVSATVNNGGYRLCYHTRDTNTQTVTWSGAFEVEETSLTNFNACAAVLPFDTSGTPTVTPTGSASGQCVSLFIPVNG